MLLPKKGLSRAQVGDEIEAAIDAYTATLDPWIAGRWYDIGMMDSLGSTSNVAISANTIYAVLLKIPYRMTIDRIGVRTFTAGAAGTLYRFGMAEWRESDGLPGDLITETGTAPADAVAEASGVVNLELPRGRYWALMQSNGTPSVPAYSMASAGRFTRGGSSLGDGSANRGYTYSVAHTFGAFPSNLTGMSIVATNVFRVGVRVS